VFFNFLQYRRAQPEQARTLAQLKHNDDLCPLVQARCEGVLRSVERHRSLVYDTQGPRDHGVDVLAVLSNEDDKYIGFQVKSDVEVGRDLLKTLKSQWVDAHNRFGEHLIDYYILLAWNAKERVAAIRSVTQDFSTLRNVHVIEPAFLWTFLYGISDLQMEALVTAYLSEDDPLVKKTRESIANLSRVQLSILSVILEAYTDPAKPAPSQSDLRNSAFLQQMYRRTSTTRYYELEVPLGTELPYWLTQPIEGEDPWMSLAEDLDAIDRWIDPTLVDRYTLNSVEAEGLLALAYEGKARYGHSDEQLCEFLFDLLTTRESRRSNEPWDTAVELAISVYDSRLPLGRMTSTLMEMLQINLPELSDTQRFQLPMSVYSDGSLDWRKLARRLLDRARR
jgi:hypothetical protein